MKTIEVKITEIDKGERDLSLLNLRDEIVNFLYRDTVASSTKADQLFYLLYFFGTVRYGETILLELLFEEALPKIKELNFKFSASRRLKGGEYHKLVQEAGLTNIFRYDIFFILVEAITELEKIEEKYSSFLKKHTEVRDSLRYIRTKYSVEIEKTMKDFRATEIADERIDDHGNSLDLSKSVYRTVSMRNARNLNVNVQKYTSVRKISSESPIVLVFLQHIDPQLIFGLWDKYHLAEYISGFTSEFSRQMDQRIDTKISASDLITGWMIWKMTRDPDEKKKARAQFDISLQKEENSKVLEDLAEAAVRAVMAADTHRKNEVEGLRNRLAQLEATKTLMSENGELKKIKDRLSRLENLRVKTKLTKKKR